MQTTNLLLLFFSLSSFLYYTFFIQLFLIFFFFLRHHALPCSLTYSLLFYLLLKNVSRRMLLNEEKSIKETEIHQRQKVAVLAAVIYGKHTSLAYSFNFRRVNCTLPLQLLSVGICICGMFGCIFRMCIFNGSYGLSILYWRFWLSQITLFYMIVLCVHTARKWI